MELIAVGIDKSLLLHALEDLYLPQPRLGDNSAQSPLRVVYPGKGLFLPPQYFVLW